MNPELMAYLLSWAVFYTGYMPPAELPTIQYAPHSYFVEHICYNVDTLENPCTSRAAYDDATDGIIYMHENLKDEINRYTKGIIVHEMVHYLQDMSGDWEDMKEWGTTYIVRKDHIDNEKHI